MSWRVRLNRGFTILELLLAVVVLGVLMSLSMVGYRGYKDRTAMLVDETNQKVLQAAVKLYAYDHNALPGSLSDLRPQDMSRAFALVTEGKRPYTLLVYLQEHVGVPTAEAEVLTPAYYQNNAQITRCPLDTNGPPSYQINQLFARAPLSTLLNPANAGITLIFESDVGGDNGADPAVVAQVASRHRGGKTAIITTAGGVRGKITIP